MTLVVRRACVVACSVAPLLVGALALCVTAERSLRW
jgi:hypothetical protein